MEVFKLDIPRKSFFPKSVKDLGMQSNIKKLEYYNVNILYIIYKYLHKINLREVHKELIENDIHRNRFPENLQFIENSKIGDIFREYGYIKYLNKMRFNNFEMFEVMMKKDFKNILNNMMNSWKSSKLNSLDLLPVLMNSKFLNIMKDDKMVDSVNETIKNSELDNKDEIIDNLQSITNFSNILSNFPSVSFNITPQTSNQYLDENDLPPMDDD